MNQRSPHIGNKLDVIILLLLLLIGVSLRVYKVNAPLADFQSFRQVEIGLKAKEYVKNNLTLKEKKIALYPFLTAAAYSQIPSVPLEVWGRTLSIVSSLLIIALIYYFCLKEIGRVAALFGALFYTVFPFSVFFSRTYLPQNPALALSLLGVFFVYLVSETENIKKIMLYTATSAVAFSLGLFFDGSTIFYLIPILYLFIAKYGKNIYKQPSVYIFALVALVPYFLWGTYSFLIPKQTVTLDLFHWVFYDQMGGVVLGGFAVFFLMLGVVRKYKSFFAYTLLSTAILYFAVIEVLGNTAFEYRQIILLPIVAFFVGSGIEFLLLTPRRKLLSPVLSPLVVVVLLTASFIFSFTQVKNYYEINSELSQMANIIQTFTGPEDMLVLDKNGDSTLLYLSDRIGIGRKKGEVPDLRLEGYDYLITFNQEYTNFLKKEYDAPVVFENEKLTVFKL